MSKNNRARRREKQLAIRRRSNRLREKGTVASYEPRVMARRVTVEDAGDPAALDRVLAIFESEVTDEPIPTDRPDEVKDLAFRGYECLERGDFAEAEVHLRQAVDLFPDAPDLWNNLAAALDGLDREEEAREIASMLKSRYPDYFFGIIRDANEAMERGEFDYAGRLLLGLHSRKKLHVTEFRTLVMAQIKLADVCNKFAEAKAWLKLWSDVEDHPLQDEVAQQIRFRETVSSRSIGKFLRWLDSD